MESKANPNPGAWVAKQVEREVRSDVLPRSERIGQIVAIFGCALLLLFVVIHQTRPTGFFKDDGTAATVIYIMSLFGIVPIVVRLLTGRKNAARLFEVVSCFPFVIGQAYLLAEFPFDFSHFADPLPKALEFLLDWVPASLAKLLLVIGILGASVFAVLNALLYLAVKKRLASGHEMHEQEPPKAG